MFGSAVYMYTENISSFINPALQINWNVKASLFSISSLAIWCRYSFSHEFPLLLYDKSYRTTFSPVDMGKAVSLSKQTKLRSHSRTPSEAHYLQGQWMHGPPNISSVCHVCLGLVAGMDFMDSRDIMWTYSLKKITDKSTSSCSLSPFTPYSLFTPYW